MKRFFLLALCLAVCFGALCAPTATANAATDSWQQSEEYLFMKEFVEAVPDRSGLKNTREAAEWLRGKFNELLLPISQSATVEAYGDGAVVGYNVVSIIPGNGQTGKTVIIGAHYDSIGQGANDNAGGIAAMYFAMKTLVQSAHTLPFNICFVAFGGEEDGMVGSGYFVQSIVGLSEKQSILLMFNIDSILLGDNLYLLCESKPTDLANYILQNKQGEEILEKPYAVGTFPIDIFGYGFYEKVQGSDHTPFRLAGIPVAFFFSGSFSGWDYVESTLLGRKVMNTGDDTLDVINQYCGEQAVSRIQTVSKTISSLLVDSSFLPVMENAPTQLVNNDIAFNMWWPRLVGLGILVILAVLAALYHRKLVKKSILGTGEIKTETVFSSPNAEDIFSFSSNNDNSTDVDDIFTFKK